MKEQKRDTNIIFVGDKPIINYIRGISTKFKDKNSSEVNIISRGKFISKAVDIAEASVKKFLKDQHIKIDSIKTDSQEFESKEGKKITVSTIDILLKRI